ncbi:MAG: hypothetical protein IJD94_10005 [Clostridia bacterium]|nr:hypothetical protein [Clostridia bacterium]
MEKKMLYRYMRKDGGVTTSPAAPPEGTEYDTCMRLIAGEGMMLTDGERIAPCVDTDDPEAWVEIDAPDEDVNEAAAEDYQAALEEMGCVFDD